MKTGYTAYENAASGQTTHNLSEFDSFELLEVVALGRAWTTANSSIRVGRERFFMYSGDKLVVKNRGVVTVDNQAPNQSTLAIRGFVAD